MGTGDVLFEFTQVGQHMRVAAVDDATGTEVIVIAPASAAPGHMKTLALAKLRRKLEQVGPAPCGTGPKYA